MTDPGTQKYPLLNGKWTLSSCGRRKKFTWLFCLSQCVNCFGWYHTVEMKLYAVEKNIRAVWTFCRIYVKKEWWQCLLLASAVLGCRILFSNWQCQLYFELFCFSLLFHVCCCFEKIWGQDDCLFVIELVAVLLKSDNQGCTNNLLKFSEVTWITVRLSCAAFAHCFQFQNQSFLGFYF